MLLFIVQNMIRNSNLFFVFCFFDIHDVKIEIAIFLFRLLLFNKRNFFQKNVQKTLKKNYLKFLLIKKVDITDIENYFKNRLKSRISSISKKKRIIFVFRKDSLTKINTIRQQQSQY